MKKTMVSLMLAALLFALPAGAASRHPNAPEVSAWSEVVQLWHHALRMVGLEKDGTTPPPPTKWPTGQTNDGTCNIDPNGLCKPNP